jgi:hypothetical protein
MRRRIIKPQFVVTGVLVLASVVVVTAAIDHYRAVRVKPGAKHPVALVNDKPIVYDSILLKKFIRTIHSLDFNKPECTYRGIVNLTDRNDTTNNVNNLKFLFSRSGSNYYYRVGDIEILYRDGLNLYVQHDQRKIALSNQAIVVKPPISNISIIEKDLQWEHYALENSHNGRLQTLSLINEHHISCKEIAVTLDTISGKLTRIFTRMTDFGSPADKHKERIMDVRIEEIKDRVNMALYPSWQQFIKKSGGKWHVTDAYKNYELIQF